MTATLAVLSTITTTTTPPAKNQTTHHSFLPFLGFCQSIMFGSKNKAQTNGFLNIRNRVLKKKGRRSPRRSLRPSAAKNNVPTPLSPPAERRLQLLPKIAEFRAKGYLSAAQERVLMGKLTSKSSNPFDTSNVKDVEAILDEIGAKVGTPGSNRFFPRKTVELTSRGVSVTPCDSNTDTSGRRNDKKERTVEKPNNLSDQNTNRKANIQANSLTQTKQSAPRTMVSTNRSETVTAERHAVSVYEPEDMTGLDEDTIQACFVEMCFFARLGFIQPPCCLQCVYRESIENKAMNPNCSNLVVWRKDANATLHPNGLAGNLVLLHCHEVRKLTGQQGTNDALSVRWDVAKRELVPIP